MKYFILIVLLVFMTGCTNSNIESADKIWEVSTEHRVNGNLRESITNLKKIMEYYPNDEYSIMAQFQIADIYLNDVKDYDFAVDEFQKLLNLNNDHDLSKKALFMVGYIYSNYLDSYTDAMIYYKQFLEEYPDDELIPSVQFELEGLKQHVPVIDSLNAISNI